MASSQQIDTVLLAACGLLDVPPELYDLADQRYREVGTFLDELNTRTRRASCEVYSQGSFRLGTMIRPMLPDAEFDVDLVYVRDVQRTSITQETLKRDAESDLEAYRADKRRRSEESPRLTASKRCWRLDYENEPFHMDVLPAIPDEDSGDTSIAITDLELRHWQLSDPKAYATWFLDHLREDLVAQRKQRVQEGAEPLAEWRERSPLQRVVQLLKRHRDLAFANDPDDAPASIIITTLAARAYARKGSLFEALVHVVDNMSAHVERRAGVFWVPNPVHAPENFADRWRTNEQRAQKFFRWIQSLSAALASLRKTVSLEAIRATFSTLLGQDLVSELEDRDQRVLENVGPTLSALATRPPALADRRHVQSPPWPVRQTGRVRISAAVYNEANTKQLWPLRPTSYVPRGRSLRLAAHITSVSGSHEVQWQVVNTGAEASTAGQLRGGFEPSNLGPEGRKETTQYRGTHWVEAFVLQNGTCVARSGRYYVRIV